MPDPFAAALDDLVAAVLVVVIFTTVLCLVFLFMLETGRGVWVWDTVKVLLRSTPRAFNQVWRQFRGMVYSVTHRRRGTAPRGRALVRHGLVYLGANLSLGTIRLDELHFVGHAPDTMPVILPDATALRLQPFVQDAPSCATAREDAAQLAPPRGRITTEVHVTPDCHRSRQDRLRREPHERR